MPDDTALPSGIGVSEGLLATQCLASREPASSGIAAQPREASVDWAAFRRRIGACNPGTGGSLVAWFRSHDPGTGWFLADRQPAAPHGVLLGNDEKIALIRSALSLNIKELAQALRVQRPTVYAWISGDAHPRESNRRRLNELAEIAREWLALTSEPVGALRREPGESGLSVLDLLMADEIDRAQAADLLRAAHDRVRRRQQAEHDEVTRLDLAGRARRRGVTLEEAPGVRRTNDLLIGRRPPRE